MVYSKTMYLDSPKDLTLNQAFNGYLDGSG